MPVAHTRLWGVLAAAVLVVVGVLALRVSPATPGSADPPRVPSTSPSTSTSSPAPASNTEFCAGFGDLADAQTEVLVNPGAGARLAVAVEEFRRLGRPVAMPAEASAGLDVVLEGLVDPNASMDGRDNENAAAFGTYLNAVCGGSP